MKNELKRYSIEVVGEDWGMVVDCDTPSQAREICKAFKSYYGEDLTELRIRKDGKLFEEISLSKANWFEIEGAILADVDEETFNNEFLLWLSEKQYNFAGVVKLAEEEEKERGPIDTFDI